MAESPNQEPTGKTGGKDDRDARGEFRWRSFFQRSAEPVFVLNRRKRILFVNHAWEELTGLPAAEALGLICSPRGPLGSETGSTLARTLCPPPEALHGQSARVRRQVLAPLPGVENRPAGRCWDIDFFPLRDDRGLLGIVGKIQPVVRDEAPEPVPLPEKLIALRESAVRRYALDHLDSELPSVRRVAEQVRLAARGNEPFLIVGEPGTGKRWVARAVHNLGRARERAVAAVSCTSLPPTTLGEILFGDSGLLRRAGLGMLYLQAPAALPRDLQAALCAWLAEAGGAGPRLAAGSNFDPAPDVATGRLLDSLYCALATLTITLPPLRSRRADLPSLVDHFLDRIGEAEGRRLQGLSPAAWELIRDYSWPGNLRELFAVLASACLRARGDQIDAADLPAGIRLMATLKRTPGPEKQLLPLDQLLEQAERQLILLALRRAKGNKSRAAELLAIWRPRLHRRMEALGIPDGEEPRPESTE